MMDKKVVALLLRQVLDRAKAHPHNEVRLSADEKKALRVAIEEVDA